MIEYSFAPDTMVSITKSLDRLAISEPLLPGLEVVVENIMDVAMYPLLFPKSMKKLGLNGFRGHFSYQL